MKTYIPFLEDKEKEILEEIGNTKYPIIIAISGLSGSGKGTHSKILQEKLKEMDLDLQIYESGEFFREVAKKHGYEGGRLDEFSEFIGKEENTSLRDEVDTYIEKRTLEKALKEGGIFVGRLTYAVIGDLGCKVFLTANPTVISERISSDKSRPEYGQSKDVIKDRIVNRDKSDISRYENLYSINYNELTKKCDFTIENSGSKEEVSEEVVSSVVSWLKENKFL